MSEPHVKSVNWPAIGFLFLVNLIAISLFLSPGTGDVGTWARWMRGIDTNGLIGGYAQSDSDYPPLSFVLLASISRSAAALEVSRFVVLKGSILLFLFATAACFYAFTRNVVLTAALELSLILNSIALGYLDIWFAPFLVAAFFLLQRGQLILGFLSFVISCSIKWQPIIVTPFICVYIWSEAKRRSPAGSHRLKRQLLPFAVAGALTIALFLIFGGKILDSLQRATMWHAFLSGYALNLGWIQTWLLHLLDPEKYGRLVQGGVIEWINVRDPIIIWPNKILFYLSYAAILAAFARGKKHFSQLLIYSMLGYLAYFSFNTGVHENHLFLICCLAWILVVAQPAQLMRCLNFNLAANANLFLFFGVFGQRLNPVIGGIDITLLFSVANLCLFAGFLVSTIRSDGLDLWMMKLRPKEEANQSSIT